jgi:hypothetical protein
MSSYRLQAKQMRNIELRNIELTSKYAYAASFSEPFTRRVHDKLRRFTPVPHIGSNVMICLRWSCQMAIVTFLPP